MDLNDKRSDFLIIVKKKKAGRIMKQITFLFVPQQLFHKLLFSSNYGSENNKFFSAE